MERKFNTGDIVKHFKREKMTEEQLKEEPNLYLYGNYWYCKTY